MNFKKILITALAALGMGCALADDASIRKNLSERFPKFPKIDEISKTPIPGLMELRVNGTDIFYSDADGNYLIQGRLIDTKTKRNLTDERIEKLLAIDFDTLPFKDAMTIVRGNGKRKLAVFSDPNCGYCKRFERDIAKVTDVTIYVFLYPVLGTDSIEKSKAIWCAKDNTKVWQDFMVRNQALPAKTVNCNTSALDRNKKFGESQRIDGTPTLIFSNNTRISSALSAADVEKLLNTP